MEPKDSYTCVECDFSLWIPIADLGTSYLGLYDDARFPGRSILALKHHYESWWHLSPEVLHSFADDSQRACKAISIATGSDRINIAVLGNTDPHIHFHLIPRLPDREPLPNKSPWDDPRPKESLGDHRYEYVESIRRILTEMTPL